MFEDSIDVIHTTIHNFNLFALARPKISNELQNTVWGRGGRITTERENFYRNYP